MNDQDRKRANWNVHHEELEKHISEYNKNSVLKFSLSGLKMNFDWLINKIRIKKSLRFLSLMEYRQKLGLVA